MMPPSVVIKDRMGGRRFARSFSRSVATERLVNSIFVRGFNSPGYDGAHSARAYEFGDGGQKVDGENEQVNHRYGR
jgi:hypothetical protein